MNQDKEEQQPVKGRGTRRERLQQQIKAQMEQNAMAATELDRLGIQPAGPDLLFSAQIQALIRTLIPEGSNDHLVLELNFHTALWDMFFSKYQEYIAQVGQQRLIQGVNVAPQGPGNGQQLILPPGFGG